MFKLMIIFALANIAAVQCGIVVAPTVGELVSERVIESHGNNVVHASAPSVAAPLPLLRYADVTLVRQQPVVAIAQPTAVKAPLTIAESSRTIEAHGHSVIHDSRRPLIATELAYAVPSYYYSTYPHRQLIGEKTVSSYGHSVQHVA